MSQQSHQFKPNPVNELALRHAGDLPVKAICEIAIDTRLGGAA